MEYEKRYNREAFLHNVNWIRKHYGFSAKEMSKIFGASLEQLASIEKGIYPRGLDLDFALRLSDFTGISITVLTREYLND